VGATLPDVVELRELADRYCSAVDDGDAARMAGFFAPGGKLVVFEPGETKPLRELDAEKDFPALIVALGRIYNRTFHFVGNHWCDVNADRDRAAGETYLLAMHLRSGADGEVEEVAAIRYRDSYVRTAAGWRFEVRSAHRQWTTARPVSGERHGIDRAMRPDAQAL
jgi:hypothetical protein